MFSLFNVSDFLKDSKDRGSLKGVGPCSEAICWPCGFTPLDVHYLTG